MIKKYLKKVKHRDKLYNAFHTGEIYYSTNRNGNNIMSFPKILDVRFTEQRTQYIFKLPHGVSPKELKKKEHVFKYYLGENIELNDEGQIMTISVWQKVMNDKFTYQYNDELTKKLKKYKLPLLIGMDKLGKKIIADMVESPHPLIAGETGGGKSTILRSILTTLILFKNNIPNGLEMYMVDFKRSEFHLFRYLEDISVINKKNDFMKCLNYLNKEIERRGDILDACEVTHIDEYNSIKGSNPKPYIILVIDEIHALHGDKDSFEILRDIAAMGRALGIYLIIATQRPDKDAIDSQMKSNLTVRMAFAHADKINSDITLGRGTKEDASKITKAGQFIYRNKKVLKKAEILQAPLLEIEKAKELLEPLKIRIDPHTSEGDIIEVSGEARDAEEQIETEDNIPKPGLLGGE